MSATGYSVDLRDIRFVLHEQLDLTGTMSGYSAYADFDQEFYDSLLDEAARIAIEVLAPVNAPGDREGCHFDGEGNVRTPTGYRAAWQTMARGGWLGLKAPPEFGGMGLPNALGLAVGEMFTGACMAFATYSGLAHGAANLLAKFSPDWCKQVVCERLYSGEWCGTMCLTEADAGSSVGDNRAKAKPTDEEGVYLLEGEKVFITAGDHDLTDNIIHLVLARTPGAQSGTRGLSIFMVPKFLFDANGKLGERNNAIVTKIEEKMGLHGSATTVLTLGASGPCKGWLLGREGDGMRIMFHMMNEARISVGLQGLAGAAAAYQNALSYAKERIQGTAIEDFANPDAPRVPIVRHPDVRRMLMWQRVHVEAMRSALYTTAMRLDRANTSDDPAEKARLIGQVELMTPICKAYFSDRGFDCTVLAVQVYGGYGYIGEYPVEQHLRDTKISSIYEGTNGIQAMDLLGRKMRKDNGALFMAWLQECNDEIERIKGLGILDAEVRALEKARDSLGASAMHLGGLAAQGQLAGAFFQATPFLDQFGTVLLGLHSLIQARVAHERLQADELSEADTRFYKGKLLNASFYCHHVLPHATALGKEIRSGDTSALDQALFE